MDAVRRWAKNITVNFSAIIVQKILALAFFVLLARLLDVHHVGEYVLIFSWVNLLSFAADIGLSTVITRHGAQEEHWISMMFPSLIQLKVILGMISYGLIVGCFYIAHGGGALFVGVVVAAIGSFCDGLSLLFYAVFRSEQRLQPESVSGVLSQTIVLIGGIVVLLTTRDVLSLVWVQTISSFAALGYLLMVATHDPRLLHRTAVEYKKTYPLIPLLKLGLPFWGSGIAIRVITSIDIVLVGLLTTTADAGRYGAAQRLVSALSFVPLAVSNALFPALSAAHRDPHIMQALWSRAMGLLITIALPLVVGTSMIASQILQLIYGEGYGSSAQYLILLTLGISCYFLTFPVGAALNALHLQRDWLRLTTISATADVIVSVAGIAYIGPVAVAFGFIVANILILILGLIVLTKRSTISFINLTPVAIDACIGTIVLAVSLLLLPNAHVLARIIIAVAAYGCTSVLLGTPKRLLIHS